VLTIIGSKNVCALEFACILGRNIKCSVIIIIIIVGRRFCDFNMHRVLEHLDSQLTPHNLTGLEKQLDFTGLESNWLVVITSKN